MRSGSLLGGLLIALVAASPALASDEMPTTGPTTAPSSDAAPTTAAPADAAPATAPVADAVPTTEPTSAPTTAPSVASISPQARELLDSIDAAYAGIKSLQMAGSIAQDVRAEGRQHSNTMPFTASFLAPNFFREEVTGSMLCGSTGAKVFAYSNAVNLYTDADAPAGRVAAADDLPAPLPSLLDPSLLLTIWSHPSAELVRTATTVARGPDVTLAGTAYPALVLTQVRGDVMTFLVDPKTHLVRQVVTDARALLTKAGIPDVETALMTVDYTTITPDAQLKPEQFAWTAPAGARQSTTAQPPTGGETAEGPSPLEGKPAPAFKLTGLDGKAVGTDDLKGSVTVLDFWATWCPPCRASLPHLDQLYAEFKPQGVKVYAVNVEEEKQTVAGFVTTTKLSVPVLLDSDHAVSQNYGVQGIPQTVVIGKDGKIRKIFVGFSDDLPGQLAAEVKAAMAQ